MADKIVRPVIDDAEYGYDKVNVADQRRDRDSLLNWLERMIRARKECPEIGWGTMEILSVGPADVLAIRYDWRNTSLVTLHNFSSEPRAVSFKLDCPRGDRLVDVFFPRESHSDSSEDHQMDLAPYDWRWYRVGSADNSLDRAPRETPH